MKLKLSATWVVMVAFPQHITVPAGMEGRGTGLNAALLRLPHLNVLFVCLFNELWLNGGLSYLTPMGFMGFWKLAFNLLWQETVGLWGVSSMC